MKSLILAITIVLICGQAPANSCRALFQNQETSKTEFLTEAVDEGYLVQFTYNGKRHHTKILDLREEFGEIVAEVLFQEGLIDVIPINKLLAVRKLQKTEAEIRMPDYLVGLSKFEKRLYYLKKSMEESLEVRIEVRKKGFVTGVVQRITQEGNTFHNVELEMGGFMIETIPLRSIISVTSSQ